MQPERRRSDGQEKQKIDALGFPLRNTGHQGEIVDQDAAAAQPENTVKTPPPQRSAVKLSAVAQSHFEDLDAAIDYMRSVKLLDEEDMNVLERYLATLGAFTKGLEYAEKHAERSAE